MYFSFMQTTFLFIFKKKFSQHNFLKIHKYVFLSMYSQRTLQKTMPEHLQRSHRDKLVTWIGRPCHFQLLYKISRDGCSASTFHQKCDGQVATVTVLYNTNKTIYGGYLSQSWHSYGEYIERNPNRRHLREEYFYDQEGCNDACIYDPNAFIFRLQY